MRIRAGIWSAVIGLLLTTTPMTAEAAPGTNQGRGAEHRSERATAALEAAKDIFRTRVGSNARGGNLEPASPTADNLGATMVLRDLALSIDDLAPADRKVALRILARPTDNSDEPWPAVKYGGAPTKNTCQSPGSETLNVCVHWVSAPGNLNAPPAGGEDENGVPAWVLTNQQVLEDVWQRTVHGLGYRPPVDDVDTANRGPDQRLDVYLAELRKFGLYGYCAAEPPLRGRTAPAYCVLDNDFKDYSDDALADLKVTAAHEFFHAVQYAYNVFADVWLMEGTAAWVEDELYDGINDNLQYLASSPLSVPGSPLDFEGSEDPGEQNWRYGSWIWWRFLSEYLGSGTQPDPSVVRQVWQRLALDGPASMPAMRKVIASRGKSFGDVFAEFGTAARIAPRWYDEGRSYVSFIPRAAGSFTLTKRRRSTDWRGARLYHLSTVHAVIRPGSDLRGKWRLRVELDLPPRYRGSQATVIVNRRDGRLRWQRVRLDRGGAARFSVPFGAGSISRVTLSLANASTRLTDCGEGFPFSCGGRSPDDGAKFLLRTTAVR